MLNILIVEDEEIVLEDISSTVSDFGYNVIGKARTMKEALSIADKFHIDVCILDINLFGNNDGIELGDILSRTYNVEIIFVSAFDEDCITKYCEDISYSKFLSKPYNEGNLKLLLNEINYKVRD